MTTAADSIILASNSITKASNNITTASDSISLASGSIIKATDSMSNAITTASNSMSSKITIASGILLDAANATKNSASNITTASGLLSDAAITITVASNSMSSKISTASGLLSDAAGDTTSAAGAMSDAAGDTTSAAGAINNAANVLLTAAERLITASTTSASATIEAATITAAAATKAAAALIVTVTSGGGANILIKSKTKASILFNYPDTCGEILGFKHVGNSTSILDFSSKITNYDPYMNSINLDPVGNIITYSSGFMNFVGKYNYFLMYLNDIEYIYSNNNLKSSFGKIQLSGNPGDILFNTFVPVPNDIYYKEFPISTLIQLKIKFTYPDGSRINFRNINHSFTLKITEENMQNDNTYLNSQNISVIDEYMKANLKD
jgi:hypothetical protein